MYLFSLPILQEDGVPVAPGPVFRGRKTQARDAFNLTSPLQNFKGVSEIVDEIVDEGEGIQFFERDCSKMLKDFQSMITF